MRNVVITGGTDGIGRALAQEYLRRGETVVVVGSNAAKGRDVLAAADRLGAGDRARFLRADLSLVSAGRRVVRWIEKEFDRVDLLVLAARYHRPERTLTAEGFESNFALFYLSRFVLSHGLSVLLARASRPVVLNFAACGLAGPVRWDDLQGEREYHGVGAMGHAGSLNDLLGAGFAAVHPGSPVAYVLNHPGVVATSFAGDYDPATAERVDALKRSGKTVHEAVAQILPHLDSARPGRLTAVVQGRQVSTDTPAFDERAASRLDALTRRLLAPLPG